MSSEDDDDDDEEASDDNDVDDDSDDDDGDRYCLAKTRSLEIMQSHLLEDCRRTT